MTSVKVPVLVSKYADDLVTALVIDGPEADASGTSIAEALESVRRFLKKQGERDPDQYWPRISHYDLHHTEVRVRLYYRDGKRQFPASREMKIPVRYVLGRYVDDSVECFLPDYEIVFYCAAIRELPMLIEESVRGAAARLHSRELIAATPPRDSELRIVRVRLKERAEQIDPAYTKTLSLVAEPMFNHSRRPSSVSSFQRIAEVHQINNSMDDSSVLLVGPSGSGKTTVARQAAYKHQIDARSAAKSEGQPAPPPLIWTTSAENLIAGMQYLGQWEERVEDVIAELQSIHGLLHVSSLVDLVRLGGSQPDNSLAAFLMPFMRRGELRLIAETSPEELDAARRLLPGWAESFQIINIDPISPAKTQQIAASLIGQAARNHRLQVEATAAGTATRLFAQFMPYQAPPRGVVQLVNDVIEQAITQQPTENVGITTKMVVDQFTKLTGLPESMLRDSETLTPKALKDEFSHHVIGQSSAVEAVTNVVLRLKAGLCDPRRPIATMLFCGPTGVGKTQLARSLADYLFGHAESNQKPLVRMDMSEYGGWDAVDRFLIGSDGEVAPWIGRLRANPMSVLLFDEFEKSSPEVHDCLLSALDEGRLTDRFGRTTTLCGAIVILTSNVGSRRSSSIGFGEDDSSAMRRAIQHEFRPEFLNRLDEIVIFAPLPSAMIELIVEKELKSLAKREALVARRVQLRWDDTIIRKLAAVGFDPLLGARPLQRTIEREVVAKIARHLLENEQHSGPTEIELAQLL